VEAAVRQKMDTKDVRNIDNHRLTFELEVLHFPSAFIYYAPIDV
jgi:hypothetical protein